MKLFSPFEALLLTLPNRIVMAPLGRARAIHNTATPLMEEYYSQRASAGLIITEGVAPCPSALGHPRIPGIYTQDQREAWRKVTQAIHRQGGRVFIQLMHTGRISHPDNMAPGTAILAPSAIPVRGAIYTDTHGFQAFPVPIAMTIDDIVRTQDEFAQAAKNAMQAGFDGVEIHAGYGYLVDQFMNPASNQRSDDYGGPVENRCRFALEVVKKTIAAIGRDRLGVRLSPYNELNDMVIYEDLEEDYSYLVEQLQVMGLAYLHVVGETAAGLEEKFVSLRKRIRKVFDGIVILCGGYSRETAEEALQQERGDLIAFGRPFIANPDFVWRLQHQLAMNPIDTDTLYTPGARGYTDYPVANKEIDEELEGLAAEVREDLATAETRATKQ